MYKKIIFLVLLGIVCQVVMLPVYAVKAYPRPFIVTQPDGTQLTIRLQGDERRHFKTTEDGYVLKANSRGFLTYASVNPAGEIEEGRVIARDILKRSASEKQFLKTVNQSAAAQILQQTAMQAKVQRATSAPQKAFPHLGSPKSLVILVNYLDNSFISTTPKADFTSLLNQSGYSANGATGSVRDYFMASSYGKFAPSFDVVGPYTLPNNLAYYGANSINEKDVNSVQMIVDACTLASSAGVDFSQYDTDSDGIIDNVFVFYAGHDEAEGGSTDAIWAKFGKVYPVSQYGSEANYTGTDASITFNGKLLVGFACTSELADSAGNTMRGIGTFCHEFGHVIGLPDYYNTSNSDKPTLNYWSIMDAGNYNNNGRTPPTYSAYDRFYLGWLTPEQKSTQATLTLLPIYQGTTEPANTTNQAFLLAASTHNLDGKSPDPSEFFIAEYRKQTGWDTYLPGEGLCIWHVDYSQSAWANNAVNVYAGSTQTQASHMRLYLQPLSGSTTSPGSAFTSGSFTPMSWSNVDINRAITNINKSVDRITFNFMPDKMSATAKFTDFVTTYGTPTNSQDVTISAMNLTSNLNVSFQNSVNFELKRSSETTWSKTLSLTPSATNVTETINVRYNPKGLGAQTDQLNITNDQLATTGYSLSGTSSIGPNSPVILAGTVENTLLYYPTKQFSANKKSINIKTTDIVSDLTLTISGTDAALFSISTNSITKDAANGIFGNDINVTYTPTTVGTHNATLTISGGGLPDRVIALTGTGY